MQDKLPFNHDFLGELPFDSYAFDGLKKEDPTDAKNEKSLTHLTAVGTPEFQTQADFKEQLSGAGREHGEIVAPEMDDVIYETDYLPKSPTEASFDPRFAFEIALAMEPTAQVIARYNLSESQWAVLKDHPSFVKAVGILEQDMLKNGTTFRLKAKVQAESYLKDVHILVKSSETSAAVKANMIQWITRVADLEPPKAVGDGRGNFQLTINMG